MIIYARFYELVPLVSFIASIFLISVVLKRDWRSSKNRALALFLFALGMWGLTIFGMRTVIHPHGADLALNWGKAAIASSLGVGLLFYHFTVFYTRTRAPTGILPAFYLIWIVLAVLTSTSLVVSGTDNVTLFGGYAGWSTRLTNLGIIYVAIGYVPVLLALRSLAGYYRRSRSPDDRNRTAYILVGAFIFSVGTATDFLFTHGLIFYPFAVLSSVLFAGMSAGAVLGRRLPVLRLAMRRVIPYSIMGVFAASVYGAVFVFFSLLFQSHSDSVRLLVSIAAATMVAIALQPLWRRLEGSTGRWFDAGRYRSQRALQQLSLETGDIADLQGISDTFTDAVRRIMGTSSAYLLLPAHHAPQFYVASASEPESSGGRSVETLSETVSLKTGSPILSWLRQNEGILTKETLESMPCFRSLPAADLKALSALAPELFVALKPRGDLTGLLVLGLKPSEQEYSAAEVELIQALAKQASPAIENARLYAREAQRLEELERLEEVKQTLLLTVSHELKTPLTSIKAGTEMLHMQDDVSPDSARGRLYSSIGKGVERLERLIDESLDYARMQDAAIELDLEPTDLGEMYQEIVTIAMPPTKAKRQRLELHVPEDVPTVFVDRRRCERILLNLITNANKYTDAGGTITVDVRVEPTCLVTSVADTGRGIPDRDLETIFDVYYQTGAGNTRGAGQSTGLGLAIVKYLVELHGGRIWVESEVGVGSSFYFTTPINGDHETPGD